MPVFSRDELLSHIVGRLRATPLETSPFEHVRLSTVFPESLYPAMLEQLPETRYYGQLKHSDAMLPSGLSARRKLELRPAQLRHLPEAQRTFWTQLGAVLESPEVESAYRKIFADALGTRDLGKATLRPVAMLLRDLGGYKISIHTDSLRKAITTQYYLPRKLSQVHLGTAFHDRNPSTGTFTKVKSLEFAPNTGYAFPVTDYSWHSVEPMTDADGERNTLMLIYYIKQGLVGEAFVRIKRTLQDVRSLLSV